MSIRLVRHRLSSHRAVTVRHWALYVAAVLLVLSPLLFALLVGGVR